MSNVHEMLFCFRCHGRRLFAPIGVDELLWVCGGCGGVRDLTDEGRDD